MQITKVLDGELELDKSKFNIITSYRNAEPHSHSFIEIVYFFRGKGTHEIDGKTFNIHSGDIFLINANTVHSYSTFTENDKPIEVYNIMFSADFLGENLNPSDFINEYHYNVYNRDWAEIIPKYIAVRGDINHNIFSLYDLIYEEFIAYKEGSGSISLLTIKHLINVLLIKLFNSAKVSSSSKILPIGTSELISDALDYMNIHCCEQLTLQETAKKYNYSPQYFNKLLQHQTGTSFTQYLQKCKMQHAASLLENTDLSVDEVCGKVGYVDLKHFYSVFKKHVGVPPAKYRTYVMKQSSAKNQ